MTKQVRYGRISSTLEPVRLRADARRNRAQVLLAARDVFVEQGPDAPLDDVARRAGVGIATLYRRFPDRESLMRAVALDVLGRVGAEARQALDEEPDAFHALARYMHRALDFRIAAVMPTMLGRIPLDEDEEIARAREFAVEPVQRMIELAQGEGSLRPDVAFGDVGLMLVRISRPLPGAFPRELNDQLAHRHVDLLLQGLRNTPDLAETALPGPAMALADLRSLSPEPRRPASESEVAARAD
jgi:AcrR family transcriptional regulator